MYGDLCQGSEGGYSADRPLSGRYRQLMLDDVVLTRRTGAGAIRRPVLVALGIRPDGKKEIIDFHLAGSESAGEWEAFLTGLFRRGLTGEGAEMICVDGGKGLLLAGPRIRASQWLGADAFRRHAPARARSFRMAWSGKSAGAKCNLYLNLAADLLQLRREAGRK